MIELVHYNMMHCLGITDSVWLFIVHKKYFGNVFCAMNCVFTFKSITSVVTF